MAVNYKAELVGVLGYPVAENPTCVMQEAAFAALGLNWRYLTMEVKPENLADAMRGVRALGMRGINLTIPHKVAVMALLDDIASDVKVIGAVNTVYREGDRLIGANTDGKGFLRGLREAQIDPQGKRVAVLGAGGAARAITFELAFAGVSELIVINRGIERGQQLVTALRKDTSTTVQFVSWSSTYVVPSTIDILVNATSIGLFPNVHEKPDINYDSISSKMVVCDVIHTPMTPFLKEARDRGAKIVDGLGMLVYQGAIGFKLWTGLDAPVAAMHKALSKAFNLE